MRAVLVGLALPALLVAGQRRADAAASPVRVRPLTVHAALKKCLRAPEFTRFGSVRVRGYFIERLTNHGTVQGALFDHRVAPALGRQESWPPPGGLYVTVAPSHRSRLVPVPEARWVIVSGTLICGPAAIITVRRWEPSHRRGAHRMRPDATLARATYLVVRPDVGAVAPSL